MFHLIIVLFAVTNKIIFFNISGTTAIVKANMSVLLGRLGMVGEGAAMASKRRQWGRMEEARVRREREVAWRAETTGREVVRRGQFWLR